MIAKKRKRLAIVHNLFKALLRKILRIYGFISVSPHSEFAPTELNSYFEFVSHFQWIEEREINMFVSLCAQCCNFFRYKKDKLKRLITG